MVSFRQDRFAEIERDYTRETVRRLSGSLKIEHTLAQRGAEKLWEHMTSGGNKCISVLGALTGKCRILYVKKICFLHFYS